MIGISKSRHGIGHEIGHKDMLRYIAIAVIGLIGISAILQSTYGSASVGIQDEQRSGYGVSVYGR